MTETSDANAFKMAAPSTSLGVSPFGVFRVFFRLQDIETLNVRIIINGFLFAILSM